jgi:hypothetical protein
MLLIEPGAAMSNFLRFFSGFVTAIPAAVFWIIITQTMAGEYFGVTYIIVSEIFMIVSFVFGFFIPTLFTKHWKRHPTFWLFGQGLLAWLVAVLVLGLFNLSPLCIGQENGDGINDLGLCMAQTVMVPLAFSPMEFILLCLSVLPGGWLIKRLIKSEAK